MTKKRSERNDVIYDGFQHALNKTDMLQNPDSLSKLRQVSGLSLTDTMRYITVRKQSKAEAEKAKQEERINKLNR